MPPSAIKIKFAKQELILDASGVLYWPDKKLLIVSDLHLEKASFLSKFGSVLPQYDSRDTLERLEKAVGLYDPETVVCLGDSFHDTQGFLRLPERERTHLEHLVTSVNEWRWILGNHDSDLPQELPGIRQIDYRLENILLAHDLTAEPMPHIIGHFHPKAQLKIGGHRVSGRCFLVSGDRVIMPSFGSFTGGLDCRDKAINRLSATPFVCYLLYKKQLFEIS